MAHNTTEVAVGGAVLAGALAFVLYAAQATGLGQASSGYALEASFRSVEGVTIGTDVRLAGVKIGSVTDMRLNAVTYRADAQITIIDGIEIPDDSAAVVASEGLLGGNFVEILPGGSPFYYAAGDEILDTQGSVSLVQLLLRFVTGGDE